MRFGWKRFTTALFLFLALTAAIKKGPYAPPNDLSAETEKGQCVQLTVPRQRGIHGANLIAQNRGSRPFAGGIFKDARDKAQEQCQRCRDQDDSGEDGPA